MLDWKIPHADGQGEVPSCARKRALCGTGPWLPPAHVCRRQHTQKKNEREGKVEPVVVVIKAPL